MALTQNKNMTPPSFESLDCSASYVIVAQAHLFLHNSNFCWKGNTVIRILPIVPLVLGNLSSFKNFWDPNFLLDDKFKLYLIHYFLQNQN